MRGVRCVMVVLAGVALSGCWVSRNIVDREPIRNPPLTTLEQHLNYVDPDDGRPDYVIEVPQ
jgi:uncharacterized protein YneF (UPF0154 family)